MASLLRFAFLAFVSTACATASAASQGCVSPISSCAEWVQPGDGAGRVLIYRNHPLDAKNESVDHALIVVHGQGRDADNYYRHGIGAAFLADALERTVVIAPRFASTNGNCHDKVEAEELHWHCAGPGRWTSGGAAVGHESVTTFDVVDEIVRRLAKRDRFPNLKDIVIVGHSAGGQYVTRYEMSNRLHEKAGVPITYVVANPSSYTYPDSLRPTRSALPLDVAAGAPGYMPGIPAKPPEPFVAFSDAKDCTTYDNWPYGLQSRVGYSAKLSDEELKRQLAGRPTTYLLGELDILPIYGFDGSCPAMAQGPTRLARGLAYAKYVNEKLGAQHKVTVVPACGHNARCMFGSDVALPLLFPKEAPARSQ